MQVKFSIKVLRRAEPLEAAHAHRRIPLLHIVDSSCDATKRNRTGMNQLEIFRIQFAGSRSISTVATAECVLRSCSFASKSTVTTIRCASTTSSCAEPSHRTRSVNTNSTTTLGRCTCISTLLLVSKQATSSSGVDRVLVPEFRPGPTRLRIDQIPIIRTQGPAIIQIGRVTTNQQCLLTISRLATHSIVRLTGRTTDRTTDPFPDRRTPRSIDRTIDLSTGSISDTRTAMLPSLDWSSRSRHQDSQALTQVLATEEADSVTA